jgi:hypothetical protein
MQPKLLGFRVSQHQQTRFSDITGEIEIATMYVQIVQGPHLMILQLPFNIRRDI